MLGFFLRSTVLLYLLNPLSSLHWPSAPLDVFVDFAQKQFEHKSSQRQTRSLTHTPPLTHTHTHIQQSATLAMDAAGIEIGIGIGIGAG